MTTLEILKTRTEEIISEVISQLPNAMRGDRVNRTFFVKEDPENEGEITVDYFVYLGQANKTDNCFFTIKDTESFDCEDFGVEDFDDIDFRALGWDAQIAFAIQAKIDELEIDERLN